MKFTKEQEKAIAKLTKFLLKHCAAIIAAYKKDGAPYGWTGKGMSKWWSELTKRSADTKAV